MDILTFYEKLKQYCKARDGSNEKCKDCKMSGFCYDVSVITPSSLEDWRLNILRETAGYLEEVCRTENK